MNVKELLPPLVTNWIKQNRKVTKYSSYDEAIKACSAGAYENSELCDVIADKTVAHISGLNEKPYRFNPTTVYLAFAINYSIAKSKKNTIDVLDFGGACGMHYFEVRRIIPASVTLNWTVIETEEMIRAARERGLQKGELKFEDKIESVDSADFIHSSSALQYVPAPYEFLNRLLKLGAKMILLNRMMFNLNDADIITVQRSFLSSNGPGKLPERYTDRIISYPHTTMSFKKMNERMIHSGYELFSEFDEPSGSFALGKEAIAGKGLLYVVR